MSVEDYLQYELDLGEPITDRMLTLEALHFLREARDILWSNLYLLWDIPSPSERYNYTVHIYLDENESNIGVTTWDISILWSCPEKWVLEKYRVCLAFTKKTLVVRDHTEPGEEAYEHTIIDLGNINIKKISPKMSGKSKSGFSILEKFLRKNLPSYLLEEKKT